MNNSIFLVLKKELMDIFRDKKTLISSILIPFILFPVVSMVMGWSMNKNTKSVENNLKVAIVDRGNSNLSTFLKQQKNINIVDTNNAEEDVKKGKIYVALEISKDFDNVIEKEGTAGLTIIYDNSSQQSQMSMSRINTFIEQYNKEIVAKRLSNRNIDVRILNPIKIDTKTATKESEGVGKMLLTLILPMLIIIYSVTGPIPSATDLGAGEKERGTLEPLLTTKVNRMSLLWGKFLAITAMGVVSTLANLAGMLIAMNQKNGFFTSTAGTGGSTSVQLEAKALIFIGIIALLTTMLFGAFELAISIYARSFKEAQTYLSPITIIALLPIYATYLMDAKNIELIYFNIPLANAACLLKEIISGIYNPLHIALTFGWTAVYMIVALIFARFMFTKEEVIFRT